MALGLITAPFALMMPAAQAAPVVAAAPQAAVVPDAPSIEQQLQALNDQLTSLKEQASFADTGPRWVDRLHIHGFASFGVARSDMYDGGGYVHRIDGNGNEYEGISDQWDWRPLSRAGLQIAADLGSDTQLVTQFLARGVEGYDVQMQWAYLSHQLTPSLALRAGRLVLPFYMHSQYHDVGFAYPWPTLPDEVYRTVPGDTADGVAMLWDVSSGPIAHVVNLQWSNTDIHMSAGGEPQVFHVQNMISANVTSSWHALTVRLGYSGGKVSMTPSGLPASVASAIELDKRYGYFASAGFTYDDGRLLLTGESVQMDINGWVPQARSSYVTAGVHLGRWLPLLTHGRLDTSDHVRLGSTRLGTKQQQHWGFGVRFSATSNVALKAELDHVYGLGDTGGLFTQVPDDGNANILRLSVDATF